MLTLETIDADLQAAVKRRDAVAMDTLRGLKSRIKNEQIAKGGEPDEAAITALVRSEAKRRKEAVAAFEAGGRKELADKEQKELDILNTYLPAQASEADIAAAVDSVLSQNSFTVKDFGQAMAKLKAQLPNADGATLAKVLKEKLQ